MGCCVRVLLVGARFDGAGNVDELVDRLRVRQRINGKGTFRFVLIQQHSVQSDIKDANARRQVAHFYGNAPAKIALPHDRDGDFGGTTGFDGDLLGLGGHYDIGTRHQRNQLQMIFGICGTRDHRTAD